VKISTRQLKNLISSALNEAAPPAASSPSYAETKRQQSDAAVKSKMDAGSKEIRFKSDEQQALEKELADLNKKAIDAIGDEATKRKVQLSIEKLMDIVDKGKFNDAKKFALNVYAGPLGDVNTSLKGMLQAYDKNAGSVLSKLRRLESDEKKASASKDKEAAAASSKPKPKKKGLSSSGKDMVKKIQSIIGAKSDGSWGPNTTTKWKAWITSDATFRAIQKTAASIKASLTKEFLKNNAGKAAKIAEKAGKTPNLDGVLELAELIKWYTDIIKRKDDSDYGEISDRVTDPNYEGPIGDGRHKYSGKIYKTAKEAEAAASNADYAEISDRVTDPNYEGFVGDGRYKVAGKIYDSFEAALRSGSLKETKIRKMIRKIVLENLRPRY